MGVGTHSIHPFPARMAAELALAELRRLPANSNVLDPMAGSGTVLRAAADEGHRALGFDTDPLAVLMSRVWTSKIDVAALRIAASGLARMAEASSIPRLPWIDDDPETSKFINFWFGERQQADLRRLSGALQRYPNGDTIGDALKIALSRLIVTKGRGASLARDTSHSRPHRAYAEHDFAVIPAYRRSVERLAARLTAQPSPGGVKINRGDARQLTEVATATIDAVITSPPYLNAIDYMRGHRLALVWLGHRIAELRAIRSKNIGSERAPDSSDDETIALAITGSTPALTALPRPTRRMIDRYALDLHTMLGEIHRVLRVEGRAVFVVGNSCLQDVFVENDRLVAVAAEQIGLRLVSKQVRELPAARRYLPPPTNGTTTLTKRMRTESVMIFTRP